MFEFESFEDFLASLSIYTINHGGIAKDDDKKFGELLSEEIRQFGKDSNDSGNSYSKKGSGEGNEIVFVEGNGPDN